jgi:hypothetical protein
MQQSPAQLTDDEFTVFKKLLRELNFLGRPSQKNVCDALSARYEQENMMDRSRRRIANP